MKKYLFHENYCRLLGEPESEIEARKLLWFANDVAKEVSEKLFHWLPKTRTSSDIWEQSFLGEYLNRKD